MAYEDEMRKIASQLIAQHGQIKEVHCGNHPGDIEIFYKDGESVKIGAPTGNADITMMKFGYQGTGTRCFHAFLVESGFKITYEQVVSLENGTVFE